MFVNMMELLTFPININWSDVEVEFECSYFFLRYVLLMLLLLYSSNEPSFNKDEINIKYKIQKKSENIY